MEKDLLIFNLNKALQLEYTDVFSYIREAKFITEAAIRSIFEQYGLMEIRHADMLAQHILSLGGKALWDFVILQNKTDFKDILVRHMDYENRAIDFYGKLIEQVDDETKILLRGIRNEEEAHLLKLKDILTQNA